MSQIEHFVPGNPAARQDDDVLARLRWPIPPGVLQAYVDAYTQPGSPVLLPFCQAAAEVRELLRLGRQPLAIHYDPLLVLLVQMGLFPLPARELDAAVTRLGDSLKQGVPLRRVLDELYATVCPACLRPAVADYVIWEQGLPVAKHLHCPECEWEGEAGIERTDLEPLDTLRPRGMHYHYVLDRVAPQPEGNALRPRLEPLLELYTPRNLAALADLTRKIETLPEGPGGLVRRALWVVLLDCLDRCSVLWPAPGSSAPRRALARPARFIERNVWRTFEAAAARVRAWAELSPQLPAGEGAAAGSGLVSQGSVRELPGVLPAGSLPLIVVSPPPLDLAAWSLSYLWGAWLLGPDAVATLRSLLRPRTPDPAWYARVMAGSFRALADLLAPDGHLLLVLTGQRPPMLEALLRAAASAGLRAGPVLHSHGDYRLELTRRAPEPVPGVSRAGLRAAAREVIVNTIRVRGEPTPWRSLHAAVYGHLSAAGLLSGGGGDNGQEEAGLETVSGEVKAAWEAPGLLRLEGDDSADELWWLARPGEIEPPLADRVEVAAYEVLSAAGEIDEATFAGQVYAAFPGALTPDADLLAACLRAYAEPAAPGRWRLRAEDLAEARRAERQEMIGRLLALGERLGYRARPSAPFDAAWLEGRRARAVFVVRWQALVGEALALGGQSRGARPYLVVPGGRAALASFKLARNPLWQDVLDRDGWHFIKYRHVRQLADEPEVDEYALRAIVGLDPIVEREAVQIPLF